jgi:hypothetical protein
MLSTVVLLGATASTPAVEDGPRPTLIRWDHPGHMTTAQIAFNEIKRLRPELIEPIGLLILSHPDPAPFWVAAGEAKGEERVRRMFLEMARWADDVKFTPNDRTTWHTARWAIVADDAPPEARAAAAARNGEVAGDALEALRLNAHMLANPESPPSERARALGWVMHIVGDLHQPMHVSDLFSADFPNGNSAATTSYVGDPLGTTIPLHILWDSNVLRTPTLEAVSAHALEFVQRHPRSSFPELENPSETPEAFTEWARESHQIAVDWAFDIETIPDPNLGQDIDQLTANMVKFILEGISPVDEAPDTPDEYWERLQLTSERRITLAGYRIADLIFAAADNINTQRAFIGR